MTEKLKDTKEFHNFGDEIIPQLSIDCVVFGFHENQLKVLLFKWKNIDYWALPGGFIFQNESTDQAVNRILEERTGIKNIYLELFNIFGDTNRQFGDTHKFIMESQGFEYNKNHWICQRFVSLGYYALVDFTKVIPNPDEFSDVCDWFPINEIPNLLLDHPKIFEQALAKLRLNLDSKLLGFNLLPDTFTMADLQNLYETFLDKKLSRTNFQRKMLSLDILKRVDKQFSGKAHKAPYLYRFDEEKRQLFLSKTHF
jgi:8-oxo-dGTP diphosphatase